MEWELVGTLIVAGLGALGVQRAYAAGRAEEERLDAVWSAAANRVRGELEVTKGTFFRDPVRRIQLRHGDVPIVVSTTRETALGGDKVSYTVVTAGPLEALHDVEMRVEPRGLIALGKVWKRLRLAEVATHDEPFDMEFRVHGSPAAVVRELLDVGLRGALSEVGEGFQISEGRIVVAREGVPRDPSIIVSIVTFVETIAARWARMVELPHTLAEALDLEEVEGEPGIIARGRRRGRTVTLEIRVGPERLSTVVWFESITGERVEVAREGLVSDREEMVRAVDAAIDAEHGAGAYR
ncbi:MAG: hypothetical protein JST00_15620 [Deltaproteobacteria bacterium]|nr:hypothetical protein [Deltaproteobacteria bacterium]